MSETRQRSVFAEQYAHSTEFVVLFKEGIELAEETAAYLDGPGRQEAKKLTQRGVLFYATESSRLTSQLTNAVEWLLLVSGMRDGKISLSEFRSQKKEISLKILAGGATNPLLPEEMRTLIARSSVLMRRVMHLDNSFYEVVETRSQEPVQRGARALQQLLRQAFEE